MKKLVIADDNEDIKEVYEIAFRDSDFDLTFITSSLEALSYLDNNRADVVLIDLAMREMDGLALAREIRVNEDKNGTRPARLAWFTAKNITDADRRVAKRYDVEETFTKPTDPLTLIQDLKAWLDKPEAPVVQPEARHEKGVSQVVFTVAFFGVVIICLIIGAYVVISDRINGLDAYRTRELREQRDNYRSACEENYKNYSMLIEWARQQGNVPPNLVVAKQCLVNQSIEKGEK